MMEFEVVFCEQEIRALAYSVNEAIRLWPGSPARPAEEQQWLFDLKTTLFALQMEMVYEKDEKHSEGESPS